MRELVHQCVPGVGIAIHHRLDRCELTTRLPLDQVARDRERAAAETDDRLIVTQRCTDEPHCLENRRYRLLRIRNDKAIHVGAGADRLGDHGADVLDEVDLDAHAEDGEHDVREHHGCVHVVPANRLQRHLGTELRLRHDVEQSVALSQFTVLGQRAAGLAHEPDGRAFDRLSPACPHEERFHAT